MGKLFGTDGIRGIANQAPMTCEIALNVGRSLVANRNGGRGGGRIIIGMDTRISSPMLAHSLAAGICSMGGDAVLCGVIPTPGVAYLARTEKADAGVMISASHNPYEDNGIKIFNNEGQKLTDEQEAEIEKLILDGSILRRSEQVRHTGRVTDMPEAENRYTRFLVSCASDPALFRDREVVLDCANGAAYQIAASVFSQLGARTKTLFAAPDGRNINAGCGSQHTERLSRQVVQDGAVLGLAFDGDADRLIAVDESGRTITGDRILAICAGYLKEKGRLSGNRVVSTVMSNIGLRLALEEMGIAHRITDVGDRYVLQEMLESGAVLGGEDSGHMIFLDQHTTGDGILTAVRLMEAVLSSGKPLSELADMVTIYPQILINIPVSRKPHIPSIPAVMAAIASCEQRLGQKGRVLVRYSGTQNLCRVMVEGPTRAETDQICHEIVAVVKAEIGA